MIVLDTNVISEITSPQPNRSVVVWLRNLNNADIHTTTITLAETLLGLRIMPDGKRKNDLTDSTRLLFERVLSGRILPFDISSAEAFAEVAHRRRVAGLPISTADAMIAAICLTNNMQLASRNVRDFESTGVTVVNPFQ